VVDQREVARLPRLHNIRQRARSPIRVDDDSTAEGGRVSAELAQVQGYELDDVELDTLSVDDDDDDSDETVELLDVLRVLDDDELLDWLDVLDDDSVLDDDDKVLDELTECVLDEELSELVLDDEDEDNELPLDSLASSHESTCSAPL
jgi:hypothetical protein